MLAEIGDTPAFGLLNYGILFVYLAAMFGIGLSLAGKQTTTEEYFLAGRRMPWFIVAMSMFASLTSAISYMGVPGIAYKENIAMIVLGAASIIVAPFLALTFYPVYRRLNVTTSYEYIHYRYGRPARFAVSALFMLARVGWMGTVIYAPAKALNVVTGVDTWLAILLMGALAVSYTVLGGLSAVLWTDVVQFIILVGGAVWVAVSLLTNVSGGVSGIVEVARRTDHLNILEWDLKLYEMAGIIVLISYILQLMQDYGTDQVTVQRLLATRNLGAMARAVITNSFFDFAIMGLLLFIGLGLFAYYQQNPGLLPETLGGEKLEGDKILPFYIIHTLPNGVSGLVVTAIFAAAMSSMDSGINSLATVIVSDFVRPLRRIVVTEEHDVRLARILTLVLGAFAVGVAFIAAGIGEILKASSAFLGLFAGPILALFLMGLFTRRGKFWGWIAGLVVAIPFTIWVQNYEWVIHDTKAGSAMLAEDVRASATHQSVPGGPRTDTVGSGERHPAATTREPEQKVKKVKVHFIYYFPICFGITLIIGYLASLVIPGPLADREYTIFRRTGPLVQPGDSRNGAHENKD